MSDSESSRYELHYEYVSGTDCIFLKIVLPVTALPDESGFDSVPVVVKQSLTQHSAHLNKKIKKYGPQFGTDQCKHNRSHIMQ